jgi:outer membrane protein OmpA-like peptidoglycan-associated protein
MTLAPAALADASSCRNPDWAPTPLPGFTIDSCTDKAWASFAVDLPQGSRTLEGHRVTVSYTLSDDGKATSAEAAKAYQIAQAEKAGARLVSDPGESFRAVLTRTSPQGEVWYIYDHGSGNDEQTGSYTLTTVAIAPLKQEVEARAMTAPLDVRAACKDPPWLVRQFPYFKLDGCEAKASDVRELDLPDGAKTLQGKRTTVSYTLTDDAKSPAALAVQRNYVRALQAIGAKLMSPPDAAFEAVLTQSTPVGEIWYVYDHGSGDDDSTGSYTLTTFEIAGFRQEVVAQAVTAALETQAKACGDPPWLARQFAYFKADTCNNRDFGSITVGLKDGDKVLAGRILETDYALIDKKSDPAALYVTKNYANALQKIGATLMSDPDDTFNAVLTQKTAFGELWYIYEHGSGDDESTTSYRLTTVQIGGPPPKACKIEIYGVNFDFDKATIRPDSEPVLRQVRALFDADPSYIGEIGGHTDNVGKPAYNMKLSAARAEAVKAWLVTQGVATSRLTTRGYGDTKPLVPDTSDTNRAKNRRVELRKAHCTR